MTDRTSAFGPELPDGYREAVPEPGDAAITLEPEPIVLYCVGISPDGRVEIVKAADVEQSPHEFEEFEEAVDAIDHGEIEILLVDASDVAPMPPDWLDD